jgi:hypothetical protein
VARGEGESTRRPFHPPQRLYIVGDGPPLPSGCSLGGRSKFPICAVMSPGAAIDAQKDADRRTRGSTRPDADYGAVDHLCASLCPCTSLSFHTFWSLSRAPSPGWILTATSPHRRLKVSRLVRSMLSTSPAVAFTLLTKVFRTTSFRLLSVAQNRGAGPSIGIAESCSANLGRDDCWTAPAVCRFGWQFLV